MESRCAEWAAGGRSPTRPRRTPTSPPTLASSISSSSRCHGTHSSFLPGRATRPPALLHSTGERAACWRRRRHAEDAGLPGRAAYAWQQPVLAYCHGPRHADQLTQPCACSSCPPPCVQPRAQAGCQLPSGHLVRLLPAPVGPAPPAHHPAPRQRRLQPAAVHQPPALPLGRVQRCGLRGNGQAAGQPAGRSDACPPLLAVVSPRPMAPPPTHPPTLLARCLQ